MGSMVGAPPMFQSNVYGSISPITFRFIENGLLYISQITGKSRIILEYK